MIKNYFKIAFRNIFRYKAFSFINISGLAVGMASAIFILLWIYNQWTFDKFHDKNDRIYEAWNKGNMNNKISCWAITPQPLAPALLKDFPEVEEAARVNFPQKTLFSYGEKRLMSEGSIVDASFLKIFSFPLIHGSIETALKEASSLVLTEKMAQRLFGKDNPMGKMVKLDNEDNFIVTGILKDLPTNTRFQFDYLVSWEYLKSKKWDNSFWGNNCTSTYVLLKPNTSLATIQTKVKDLRRQYEKDNVRDDFFLYPLSRWQLYSTFTNGVEEGGLITIVKLAGVLAIFILLIACINFMNLSTARSERRAKEVGIRKVIGAQQRSLIYQFIGESIFLSALAGIIALSLVALLLPAFSKFVDSTIVLDYQNPVFWLLLIGFIFLTGILAGVYPAFFLSSFRPVAVLKGTFRKVNALIAPRKVLVVLQFSFAIILIISTIIVKQQILHGINRDVGYNKEHLIYHELNGDIPKNYSLIKNELLSSGAVTAICKTSSPITEGWSNTVGIQWQGKKENENTLIDRLSTDENISKTLGLQIIQGRDFDLSSYSTDSTSVILNETALKLMGFKEPIGQIIKDGSSEWRVIGVVKDFIVRNPYKPVIPTVIQGAERGLSTVHLRLNPQMSTSENIQKIETVFKKYNPEYPFDYKFIDNEYSKKFDNNQRLGRFITLFAGLCIFISCMGLFGLATYMTENRIKEIGVRKVLGASIMGLMTLLSKDFIKLVALAIFIASPIAYYTLDKWLQSFPYHITIGWAVFMWSGLIALSIAFLTVSFQTLKAAMANPVKSLRTE